MAQIQSLSVAPPFKGCLAVHKLDSFQVHWIITVLHNLIQTQNFPSKLKFLLFALISFLQSNYL